MKATISILAFATLLLACQSQEITDDSTFKRSKDALLAIDAYYSSNEAFNSDYSKVILNVKEISTNYNIKIAPLDLDQFRDIYHRDKLVSNGRIQCTCCGSYSVEVVDEGNGCFGVVRHYSNGAASITAYCSDGNGGLVEDGSFCYE